MPVSKVDSRCFNLSQKIDSFLSLGHATKTSLTPPEFWKEIVQSEDAVSSYIVCLIAKLISLDSDHGLKPLPNVYKDLVEMSVDHSKYKVWAAKPLPTNCKSAALELQYAIITTIRHIKDCYGYTPNIHLRHMYLRWNLARNYCTDGGRKADEYEEKVISSFSVAQSKQVIHSPLNSPLHKSLSIPSSSTDSTTEEEEELIFVRRLVDECYSNHRRAFFGGLPPDQCKLCTHTNATDCLSYIRLRDLISRSPRLLKAAMLHVLNVLNIEISHSHNYGEKEVVLPLLHLFREFLTMACPVDTMDVYRSLMAFYMWPISHAGYTRGVLDQIMQEGRVRGTIFRQRLLSEHDVGLKPSEIKIRGHLIHMLVDTSHPLTRGGLLHEIFTTHQDKPDQRNLQRLIIRNVYKAVDPSYDVMELEGKLQHLSSDSLKGFCLKALDISDKVTSLSSTEDHSKFLREEVDKLHKGIIQDAESDEQRDSAVSCSSMDTDYCFTEEYLGSFPSPPPIIDTHSLDNTQYPTVLAKIREVLVTCRQKITPPLVRRERMAASTTTSGGTNDDPLSKGTTIDVKKKTLSACSSQTSLDSTGSSVVDQERPREERAPSEVSSITSGDLVSPSTLSNGNASHLNGYHMTEGKNHLTEDKNHMTENMTGDKNHMTNGDDHVSTVKNILPRSSSSGSMEAIKKRPTSLHVLQQGSDTSSYEETKDTPRSCDRISLASEDQNSETGSNKDSSPPSVQRRVSSCSSPGSRQVVRRQTCPSGMYAKRMSVLNNRRYGNPSAHQQPVTMRLGSRPGGGGVSGGSGGTSLKVKMKRNSSASSHSVKKRANSQKSYSSSSSSSAKLVKILLAGNDMLVSHAAKAYAHLQIEEPNLLSGMELRFYHIPLSRASLLHSQFPELAQATSMINQAQVQGNLELPEPMFEQVNLSGNDVHIGRYLSHLDSWYERNLMMAIHHLLRLLPSDLPSVMSTPPTPEGSPRPLSPISSSPVATLGEATRASRTYLTPSKVLIEAVSNYTREARNCIKINMYKLKLNLKNEKSHKIEHREMYMLHRLDIQRLSGKKAANRQVKIFEANVNMTQLSLDGGLIRSDLMELKDVWVIRASNIPRAGDSSVPNPESDCFELNIIKAQSEGGRFGTTKFRPSEETQYHVCDMVIETRDKPFSVMVDADSDVILDNVVRLEVLPAHLEQSSLAAVSNQLKEQRIEKINFPLMTYWPVDL